VDEELDRFKRLDLRQYAASLGYALDKSDKSAMRHTNGDKIIISRKPDGHYTYFSVRDDRDHGTIIDFLSHRQGLNLGQIRKVVRAWMGTPSNPVPTWPELPSTTRDRGRVNDLYAAMHFALRHPYLEQERGIPALALGYWRFNGRIKSDRHGNAVFPHFDGDGLCGYELKNRNFTGFAKGGSKGLWLSKSNPQDRRLVVCESAIDAISHAVLFPDPHSRYASIGGKPNPIQPELIQQQINVMPDGSEIVAAMDADAEGRRLADLVRAAFDRVGRQLVFRLQEPVGFKDWNDMLRRSEGPVLVRARMLEVEPR
jgi:hypothetical protein